MPPTRSDIESIARRAGEILRRGYGKEIQVTQKGVIDLVTEIDRQSESLLLEEIRSRFPGDRIISEESGAHSGSDCCVWYVDPLDGTVNYAHGIPIFTVSIAYQKNGKLQLGAVYDPMRDEMFSAQYQAGAWLNGTPISATTLDRLDAALLSTGFAYDIRTHPETNLDHFAQFSLRCQGVRRLGSAALDLCYVAAGRYDGFWELRLNAWDVAAGALIAQEAGARVTRIDGGSDFLTPPESILAANPILHAQMLSVLGSS
jgi:myo-inositol-1(or 4)-monophosphatase